MKKSFLALVMICALAFTAAPASAVPTLDLVANGSHSIDLVVSGLGDYILTGFGEDIYFDYGDLTLAPVDGVKFGSYLGPTPPPFSGVIDFSSDPIGDLWVYQTALISSDALFGLQHGVPSFTLATLTFEQTNPLEYVTGDFFDPAIGSATVPVPEPSTLLLLGFGLAGLIGAGKRGKPARPIF